MTEHEGRSTGFLDERVDIFNFARDRIRCCVSAVASTPAVIGEHGEVRREERSQFGHWPKSATAQCAIHQDDRGSRAGPIECDRRAVCGYYFHHSRAPDPCGLGVWTLQGRVEQWPSDIAVDNFFFDPYGGWNGRITV